MAHRLEALASETGELNGWAYRDADDTLEVYDLQGRLVSITARGGHTQTLRYDAENHLETVTGPFGRVLRFAYDSAHRLVSMTDPGGGHYRYDYDDQGLLVAVHYPDDSARHYLYEDPAHGHALTGILDENSTRFATWAYDHKGRAVSAEHAGGAERVTLTYHADGSTTVTDALGAQRTYHFTTRHGVVKPKRIAGDACSGCGGAAQTFAYDSNGRIEAATDRNGNLSRYEYNSRGLQISRTEAADTSEARIITTEWHPDYRLPTRIEEPGKRSEFSYDDNARLHTRSEHDTATGALRRWTYTYTAEGLLDSVDGPRSDVQDITDHDYDAQGNRIRTTNALGHITEITAHDAHGRPLSRVDANGVTTALDYDARGRLRSRTVGEGAEAARTEFVYDNAGKLTRLTLPNGARLEYAYDGAQRLTQISDGLGNRIAYTLDDSGNRTHEDVYDADGTLRRSQSQVFDQLGRLIETIGAGNQSTHYGYDGNGNRTSVTDPLNRTTSYHFDALNRLVSMLDAANGSTGYGYDARDNPISVTDPRALVTQYRYDGLNNRIEQTSPDTGTTGYTYDAAGNLLSRTDARGITTVYSYDALNRLVTTAYPDSDLNVSLIYDQGANGIGRLTGMTDAAGRTSYEYDIHGKLSAEIKTLLGRVYTTDYVYDLAGNLRQITYPSGRTVDYTRDAAGQITAMTTSLDGLTQTVADSIAYLPFGPLESLVHGNGLTLTDSYDLDYRLTQRSTEPVQSLGYGYDAVGNIETLSDLLDTSRSQNMVYDKLDRLVSAQGLYGSLDYGYDALGNRVNFSAGTETDSYSYDSASNRLQSISGSNARSFGYDAAGNILQAGDALYSYDASNRLVRASQGTQSASYIYNGKGERVIKTVGTQTTLFHYDSDGRLLAETDDKGATLREYLYLEGQRLAMVVGEKQTAGNVYTFQGAAKDGRTTAILSANLSDRTLQLNDSEGLDISHQFSNQTWKVEQRQKRTIVRFALDEPIKLNGRLVFRHRGDDDPSNDTAKAYLRIMQPEERRVRVRYEGAVGQTRFTASDRKTGEPVTTEFAPDDRRITITFADGEKGVFDFNEENWKVTHPGPNRTRINYSYDDGHSSLNGSLLLKKHKTVATLRLQQGHRYRAVYLAMTGQTGTPASSTPGIYYMHTDHLDTPQVITDANQQIVWRTDQKPFGETTVTIDTIDNPLRFPGQYFDSETGLHYNYFRDYDPTMGRYIESDPIGLEGGLNTYAYVGGNPLTRKDPLGLFFNPNMDFSYPEELFGAAIEYELGTAEEFNDWVKRSAGAIAGCVSCEATCLFPVLASDVASEGIAQQMDKARKQARSAAVAGKLGRTIRTFRSISGVGTALGVVTCTIECKDVCNSCR